MCMTQRKIVEAEATLREALDADPDLPITEAAKLGDLINALVRWKHGHAESCNYCIADRVADALTEQSCDL